ncbi:alkaline phosphatase family protein [Rathayibacter soli]|uniref:alkaline phosphatase family protein n=1 Tax=Rathayibacter soli TaxID=3144168 RepID=UPI0027E3E904|nr:alkaline phosphatase family protein [Glaciibacter superstes]
MGTMLPAGYSSARSLADVLPSCVAALAGRPNLLKLPQVDRVVVIVVDGLGSHPLRARAGHARFLASRLTRATTMMSGFPTTTAVALTSLCTGTTPGRHGMVGYTVLDPVADRVFNQLSGWKGDPDPAAWQRCPTVFESAKADRIAAFAIGPERYRSSSFSTAILSGADYVGAKTIEHRFAAARRILDAGGRSISYLYVPELDIACHAHGWQSDAWLAALEEVDSQVAAFAHELKNHEAGLVTADHGVLDVPTTSHVLFDTVPELLEGVRHVAGDPRCLQLHLAADASEAEAAALAARWTHVEGHRAWVATRAQAIEAGWFGANVDPAIVPRIGHLLIAARGRIAYYDSRTATKQSLAMIGQHGSFTVEELAVPLIGVGAFA